MKITAEFVVGTSLIIWLLCAICKPIKVDHTEDLED